MNDLLSPLASLKRGQWFKLICGASFQDLPAIRHLSLIYTLAGADCIDVAADPAVINAGTEGINLGMKWAKIAENKGYPQINKPLLMVSLNDGQDPHFRKAYFNQTLCPADCLRPCEWICPAQAIDASGIIEQRCYGCGRCLPICPLNLIETRSQIITPKTILPLIQNNCIDAVEIHTQVGREKQFKQLWQQLYPGVKQLKLLAISCPDGEGLINYLQTLYQIISPLPCELIWQTDGRPMSGDIGKGTTHAAIRLGKKVLNADLPGWVQLAGGTNHHTVPKLKELGLLQPRLSPRSTIAGVAYGSYARTLISPFLETIEAQALSSHVTDFPELFWQAVDTAHSLVSPIKERLTIDSVIN
ncbi:putative alpha-helical ferredoxin [Crocosphaera subtropica ATCC 51142]|uniref:Alpha-helical ferredoxin n=1 Tax=Crocosphaera subtropica (strain ATCC 51142 / BH68) TaxID=43989 RepID=B1WQI9_CROS5|nr:LdpA C-terminal domain-containing domain [Crocosphaera subtropica]ACB51700.1 putative alpha-helical ferredoxin [Crocosphaera subtropica ATCC 51142]